MRYTSDLGLSLPGSSDYFNIEYINGNFETVEAAFGGLTLRLLTQEEYDALQEKNSTTLYVALSGTSARIYIGEFPIGGGASAPTAGASAIIYEGGAGDAGEAEEVEE